MVDISGINSSNNQLNRVTDRSGNRAGGVSKNKADSPGATSQSDRIEISASAKEASAITRLVSSAQSEPDIRPEAVAQAKAKLESGGFEGVEVSRQAARKILGIE